MRWLVERLAGFFAGTDGRDVFGRVVIPSGVALTFFLFLSGVVGALVGVATVRPWTFLFSTVGAVFTWRALRRVLEIRTEWRNLQAKRRELR